MSDSHEGQAQGHREQARWLRIDDFAAIVVRNSPGPTGGKATGGMLENGYSGRRFVLVAGIVVLLIWAALYLVFRDWRAKYRERSLYGTTQVVPRSSHSGRFCRPGSIRLPGATPLTKPSPC